MTTSLAIVLALIGAPLGKSPSYRVTTLHPSDQHAPIGPLPAGRGDNLWTISGTVNGMDANFLIDTGMDHSVMLVGPFAAGQQLIQIRIGAMSMSLTVPVIESASLRENQAHSPGTPAGKAKPFAVLGLDVLANMAVGFDYVTDEVTIWSDGRLTSQQADEWVARGGDATAHESIPMQPVAGHWFGIPATIGARHVELIVDSGANGGVLLAKLLPTANATQVARVNVSSPTAMGITTYCLAPTATAGPLAVPWWSFIAVDKIEMVGVAPVDGVFGMESFRAERVLIDMQNSTLHYRKMDRAYGFRRILLELLKLPLTFSEDKITLGPSPNPDNRTYDGKTVTSIAGVDSRDLLKAFYHPDAGSEEVMVILATATLPPRDSIIFVVDTDKGPIRVRFGAPPEGS